MRSEVKVPIAVFMPSTVCSCNLRTYFKNSFQNCQGFTALKLRCKITFPVLRLDDCKEILPLLKQKKHFIQINFITSVGMAYPTEKIS